MRALIDFLFATSGGPAFPDDAAVTRELKDINPRQAVEATVALVNLSLQGADTDIIQPIGPNRALYVYPILDKAPADHFVHFVELPKGGFSIRLMHRTQPNAVHDITFTKEPEGVYAMATRDASGARFGAGDARDVLNYVGNWMRMNFRVGTLKTAHDMSQRAMPFAYRP